jgi:hypothetical protein
MMTTSTLPPKREVGFSRRLVLYGTLLNPPALAGGGLVDFITIFIDSLHYTGCNVT